MHWKMIGKKGEKNIRAQTQTLSAVLCNKYS